MVNTFSDSPHKAAVFKIADKVHSDVLEALQRHTRSAVFIREMASAEQNSEMNGLRCVKGKDLWIVTRKWGPAGFCCPGPQNLGALNHTGAGWEAAGTVRRGWAAVDILCCHLIQCGTLRSIMAAPLFKRCSQVFVALLSVSGFSCRFINLLDTELLWRSPSYSLGLLLLVQSWTLERGCSCHGRFFPLPCPTEKHPFFPPYKKSSLLRLFLRTRWYF